jgi:hypothetical protein
VRPVAQASFWLSLLLTVYFVLQGLLLWPLHDLPIWHLVGGKHSSSSCTA